MKKTIISILCLGMAFSASAQFTQLEEPSSNQKTGSSSAIAPKPFNKVFFSYNPLSMKVKEPIPLTASGYNAIGVTYLYGTPLAKFPLYLEFGGGLQYTFYSKASGKIVSGYKWNLISLNIPVNVLYRFAFSNGKLHLAPYTGFYGRINVWGKDINEYKGGTEESSLFGDNGMSRFQLGWQIGAQFDVSKFYLHIGYLTDITSCSKDSDSKCHLGGATFGIGVVF